MSAQTETTTQAAKKPHRCSWCGQRIEVSETYKRYRYFNGSDAGTVKMHPECFEDMEHVVAYEGGGYFEWTPGDYERPTKGAGHAAG